MDLEKLPINATSRNYFNQLLSGQKESVTALPSVAEPEPQGAAHQMMS
jgi:hypothetical protein